MSLISGKTVSVEAKFEEHVATLKRRAQTSLGVGKGRLLDAAGGMLDDEQTVKEARLESGTSWTLQLQTVQMQASEFAFAAISGDGSVVTWGSEH